MISIMIMACHTKCHDDLLLIVSWLQVTNLMMCLTKIIDATKWDVLLSLFEDSIASADTLSDRVKEFNIGKLEIYLF